MAARLSALRTEFYLGQLLFEELFLKQSVSGNKDERLHGGRTPLILILVNVLWFTPRLLYPYPRTLGTIAGLDAVECRETSRRCSKRNLCSSASSNYAH
jgi:hypothetical protein